MKNRAKSRILKTCEQQPTTRIAKYQNKNSTLEAIQSFKARNFYISNNIHVIMLYITGYPSSHMHILTYETHN